MKNRIIAISREFGSGGRTIGKNTAQKLGIPCYDESLIEKFAEESGFTPEYIKDSGEYMQGLGWIGNALAGRNLSGHSAVDDLWVAQQKVILDIAEKESCVIVGRCADYILRNKADLLTVFIHASLEKRAERITKIYGETDEKPIKRLKDKDKRRAAYYRIYTDTEWGNIRNYHISLDSGELGIDKCVDILASLY